MSFRTLRWFAVVPLVAVTSLGLTSGAAARTAAPACVAADAWVASHRTSLPTTLAAFDSLTPVLQRRAYPFLTPAARVHIWQEKLEQVATTSELSKSQRAYLQTLIANLPELVAGATGSAGRAAIMKNDFEGQAARLFTREQVQRMFLTLGSGAPPTARTGETCECDFTDPFPECIGGLGECFQGGCIPSIMGCGFMGDSGCNGVCL